MDTKYIYFRIYDENPYIKEELTKGRLRQGWGWSLAQFKDDKGIEKEYETWKSENCYMTKRKFNSLKKLLEIRKGDIIVIPKVPDYQTFTICKASGDYYFDFDDKAEDFGHCIPIDVETIKVFSYHANTHTETIHSKLGAYRYPINFIRGHRTELQDTMKELLHMDTDLTHKEVLDVVKDELKTYFINKFSNSSSNNIEKLVKKVFENAGYTCIGSKHFDKKGGDADLILSKPIDILGNIDIFDNDESYTLYIQIKNKQGNMDPNELEGLNQLDKIVESDGIEKDYKKILISTIHEFQETTRQEAIKRDTVLINGNQLAELIVKYLY